LAQRPPLQGWAQHHVSAACCPPRARSVLQFFDSLRVRRKCRRELRALVARAPTFTPEVSQRVAWLAQINPDAALETFVSAFQRRYCELEESAFDQGFEFWTEGAIDFIPVLMRGTDRCNGIEPTGYRPGYALQWALIQDVFYGGERTAVIGEVADTFGPELAHRLESVEPPQHQVLCRRLARCPYRGILAFSRWVLGDVVNPIIWT
jgi:hypothetical protein